MCVRRKTHSRHLYVVPAICARQSFKFFTSWDISALSARNTQDYCKQTVRFSHDIKHVRSFQWTWKTCERRTQDTFKEQTSTSLNWEISQLFADFVDRVKTGYNNSAGFKFRKIAVRLSQEFHYFLSLTGRRSLYDGLWPRAMQKHPSLKIIMQNIVMFLNDSIRLITVL